MSHIYETYVLTFHCRNALVLVFPPLLRYSSIFCNLECPPPNSQGNLVLLTMFEVLTCGANPPLGDLLLLCTTAVRFATGDEGGVFVP